MPRIDAPTLAEHRAERERALLDAARALLRAEPGRMPTLAEVGERAGLSRSSVYQYFASREDLLLAVIQDAFPRWEQRLSDAARASAGPAERVLAFVRVNLELVADGEHALARALSTVAPPEVMARESQGFHQRLVLPLREALTELGADDPDATAELINALTHAAARRVEQGSDADREYAAVAALLSPYLRRLAGSA